MTHLTKRTCFFSAVILCGCSSSSGGEARSSDGGSMADGSASAEASPIEDTGTQSMDSPSTASPDSSSASDSGSVPYAASCGDGGGVPPTPTGQWTNATSNLAGLGSECGNMSNLSSKPDEDLLIAGIAQQGLWASKNGGTSWSRLGTGAGSATITNRTSEIVYDPAHTQTFWESGIYNANGVYKTIDDGTTLLAQGDVTHNDSVSVDFTDPQRQTLLAGTHEQSGHLYRSTDGGNTWTDIGPNLPAGTGFSSQALVIDAQTHLLGTYTYANTGAGLGIFRTTDGGQMWTQVFSSPVQGHPLVMSDGTIYWSLSNNAGMVKSVDKGQTWQMTVGQGVLVTDAPIELPDGRIAALGPSTIMVSADCGTSWHAASTALPYSAWGLSYSPYEKAFFVWHFDCTGQNNPGDPVPSDAIMRFDFDYLTQ
ncbi:MAG: WD40/YVTN/BNR-like repeat-containing protein [Polyangiaceae bacterium]